MTAIDGYKQLLENIVEETYGLEIVAHDDPYGYLISEVLFLQTSIMLDILLAVTDTPPPAAPQTDP